MFFKKKKDFKACLGLMDEPAFLFDAQGAHASCNDIARDFLEDMGVYIHDAPSTASDLMAWINTRFLVNANGCFFHEGWQYRISKTMNEHGCLLRLMPVTTHENDKSMFMSMNVLPWGVLMVNKDQDQKIVFCNKRGADLLDVASSSIIGLSAKSVLRVVGANEEMLSHIGGTQTVSVDHVIDSGAGSKWYRFHYVPFMGDFRYCLIILQDTTDEKIKESQFFQAQRLESLGQLAGGVAHDFNNILSIIDGYARLSLKAIPSDNTIKPYVENISKAVERGSSLTRRLLTFGRHKITNDKIVDVGNLVKDQELLIQPLMDASISMDIHAEKDVYAEIAPDNICQILLNLCINARDAMRDGGNLVIVVRKDEEGMGIIEVVDTGCGMTEEVKAKIFDPFFTTKEPGKGPGLGLSMVYSLVRDMGGRIDVQTKVGHGTSVRVYIPLSHYVPKSPVLTNEMITEGRFDGLTALIAEDEPELLGLVSNMLEEIGIKVLRAGNGNQALMVQEDYEGDIDFLLTDVVMPELNGVKLAELFQACRPETKVLFMSGYPANGQMARVSLPEDAFLMPKPINFEALKSVVRSLTQSGNDNSLTDIKKVTGEWRSAT